MEKEFIPYEEALALKELGFDEKSMAIYYSQKENFPLTYITMEGNNYDTFILTPTFSQSFRWFRNKYNLEHMINKHRNFDSYMATYGMHGTYEIIEEGIETYEEAELACLKKLIEIIKK